MNKIKIPLKIAFGNSGLLSKYLDNINYKEYYKSPGVYVIHNVVNNKYYVGSTIVNYWYRISACGTSHNNYFKSNNHSFINKDNLEEFEVIIFPNSNKYNMRIYESRLIRILKSYEPEFGYNHTINGQRREDLKGQKCKWVTNGRVDSMILESDTIPEGWWHGRTNHGLYGNKARLGSYQITSDNGDMSTRDLVLPEGYYPGRYGKSYSKLFIENYDPELFNRNKFIEIIDELTIKVSRKFITSLGHPVWEFMQHSRTPLKRFYNIVIIVE